MGTTRRPAVTLALIVAGTLICGLAAYLGHTQREARAALRAELGERATLTARLLASALLSGSLPAEAHTRFGGPPDSLPRAVTRATGGDPNARVLVLDASGRVLAAATEGLRRAGRAIDAAPDVRAALHGRRAISNAFMVTPVGWMVQVAVPFDTRYGRRVLVAGGTVETVRSFASGFLASASAVPHSRAYLMDGARQVLAGATGARAAGVPDASVMAAFDGHTTGVVRGRTFVSAVVPSSRWRVVFSVPTRALYAAVDGAPRRAAWLLFGAFAAAILAMVGFGLVAIRSARRLAAATERERAARQLADQRLRDPLTGLPSRLLFEDRATRALAPASRRDGSVAVLFVDIDRFKRINDSLGHAAGDAVLREVAKRLDGTVRAGDTLARFGGDEFVVLCEEVADARTALAVAERMQEALTEPVCVDGRPVPVTCSIGVAIHTPAEPPTSVGDLLRHADAALYSAKAAGRNRAELFDGESHQDDPGRLEAELALRRAIADEEFVIHYQPIVALPSGDVRGVEALVRWRRSDTGELVPPAAFIELAEETGVIVDLGAWVLRAAVSEVGAWARDGLIGDDFELAVNLSVRQLADPGLPATIAEALARWDRPAGTLCLEITESAVMADPDAAQRTLEQVDALGVRLALDDFGVGHSSLGQLARTLPISVLKLDRSFVAGMDNARDRGILEAAAAMARALEVASVAEGVESAQQAVQLAGIGFPYAQGYHFGRPVEGAELIQRLAAARTAAP